MNMRELFDDFKKYVDHMNSDDISINLAEAIEHTKNSYILDEMSSASDKVYMTASKVNHENSDFMFCSMKVSDDTISYNMYETRDLVA